LAVAEGYNYTDAAHSVGRRSGDAVGKLVVRFNQEGIAALNLRHGGGPRIVYGSEQRLKILKAIQQEPDRQKDGTATWSLKILQRNLREEESDLASGEYLYLGQSVERIRMELAEEPELV
jgi:hypothetical protein